MYVHMEEDLRSDCQTEGLPGQQARPDGKDAYSEGSGKLKYDSTAYGEITVTPPEKQPE